MLSPTSGSKNKSRKIPEWSMYHVKPHAPPKSRLIFNLLHCFISKKLELLIQFPLQQIFKYKKRLLRVKHFVTHTDFLRWGVVKLQAKPSELEDHPLSDVRDSLFSIFISNRNLRTRHAVAIRRPPDVAYIKWNTSAMENNLRQY
jgi:hypothetical protein